MAKPVKLISPLKAVMRAVLSLIIRWNLVRILVWIYAYLIERNEPKPNGSSDSERLTLLALSPDKFRGDLEILADTGRFRVLRVPYHWQTRLVSRFIPGGVDRPIYFKPETDEQVSAARIKFQNFLREFLRLLYMRLNIDGVLSADVKLVEDQDWAIVSQELGVKYFVLHRENLMTSPALYNMAVRMARQFGKNTADHIIVHSEISKRRFMDANVIAPERISVIGCLRMDKFIKSIRSGYKRKSSARRIVVFSWSPQTLCRDPSSDEQPVRDMYEQMHRALAQFAVKHPEYDILYKVKELEVRSGFDTCLIKELAALGRRLEDMPNVQIVYSGDAQKIILESDVVIAINSTVMLEAAIAGKAVIVPFFDTLRKPAYEASLKFRDNLNLFDVPANEEDLKRLIIGRMQDPSVSEEVMQGRWDLFNTYVSRTDGNVTAGYIDKIAEVIGADSIAAQHGVAKCATNS